MSGAKVYTYVTGTTTLLTTYSDSALTTPNANPIIADASGQVTIYANTNSNIRLDMYTSDGAFIRTIDPVYPAAYATGGSGGTEATIASAATTDLGSAGVTIIKVTGTTGITSFGSSASVSNPIYYVRFTGALTITNSANIVCPGGSNITTANGSAIIVEYLGSGIWQVLFVQSSSGATYLQVSNNLSDIGSAATARNNILPSQGSNSGKYLTTDGSNASWGTITTPIMTALAVGSIILARHDSGNVSAGGTVAAATLLPAYLQLGTSGGANSSGDSISGTWQALTSIVGANTNATLWQRTV